MNIAQTPPLQKYAKIIPAAINGANRTRGRRNNSLSLLSGLVNYRSPGIVTPPVTFSISEVL